MNTKDVTAMNKKIEPDRIAVLYYFGDLGYWKMPQIALDALEQGYDGPALRRLAGMRDPVEADLDLKEIDSAFREMKVKAPITKDQARLSLAVEAAARVIHGDSNVFDEATHIRIHLCELQEPPQELSRIVELSRQTSCAYRSSRSLEVELREAMADFLRSRQSA